VRIRRLAGVLALTAGVIAFGATSQAQAPKGLEGTGNPTADMISMAHMIHVG
jgi:hypothetical protein